MPPLMEVSYPSCFWDALSSFAGYDSLLLCDSTDMIESCDDGFAVSGLQMTLLLLRCFVMLRLSRWLMVTQLLFKSYNFRCLLKVSLGYAYSQLCCCSDDLSNLVSS